MAEKVGVPTDHFRDELHSKETVTEHERTLGEALSFGVSVVPTFVVDGELFWGNDRLVLLKDYLRSRGGGSGGG